MYCTYLLLGMVLEIYSIPGGAAGMYLLIFAGSALIIQYTYREKKSFYQ